MRTYNDGTYKRISKKDAEKRYNAGQIIYLLPCKLSPHNPFFQPFSVYNTSDTTWDAVINNAIYYNCNAAQGYYLSYYIKAEVQ